MSKEDKRNKIRSATELEQQPLINEEIKGKKKIHKSNKRSDHKHIYKITKIGPGWLRHSSEGELFEKKDNEYITIHSVCTICPKEVQDVKRVFIDEWKEKYEAIYLAAKNKESSTSEHIESSCV